MECSVWNSGLAGGEGPKKTRKLLDFGREDLAMPGDVYRASGLDGEREDHETSNLKDVLRRKLREMQRNKAKKSEDLRPCYTKQFFLQLATQQTLHCKVQEKIHV